MRGLAIVKEDGFQNSITSVDSFIGSFYKILPESYNITARHQGAWLDIGTSSPGNRAMSTTGFNELTAHAQVLRNTWYRGLVTR